MINGFDRYGMQRLYDTVRYAISYPPPSLPFFSFSGTSRPGGVFIEGFELDSRFKSPAFLPDDSDDKPAWDAYGEVRDIWCLFSLFIAQPFAIDALGLLSRLWTSRCMKPAEIKMMLVEME